MAPVAARSVEKDVIPVPGQGGRGGAMARIERQRERTSIELAVGSTVAEVLHQAGTHDEPVILVDGGVASIEQPVEVGPQGEPVADIVRAAGRERPDVRCFEDGQRVLLGDRAGSPVGVQDAHAEDGLAEPRADQDCATPLFFTPESERVGDVGRVQPHPPLAFAPDAASLACLE